MPQAQKARYAHPQEPASWPGCSLPRRADARGDLAIGCRLCLVQVWCSTLSMCKVENLPAARPHKLEPAWGSSHSMQRSFPWLHLCDRLVVCSSFASGTALQSSFSSIVTSCESLSDELAFCRAMLADAASRRLAVLRSQLATSPRAANTLAQQRTAATASVWSEVQQVWEAAPNTTSPSRTGGKLCKHIQNVQVLSPGYTTRFRDPQI